MAQQVPTWREQMLRGKNILVNSAGSGLTIRPSSYYPVFIGISDQPCVVIGGGRVAERKVRLLLKFNAEVKVISPYAVTNIRTLSEKKKIELLLRPYMEGDLQGAALVFAATDDEVINGAVRAEARSKGIPINVVDNPELCDFIVPSVVKKGPITVAISTAGTLPLLSKKLRKEIEAVITHDYVKYASIMGSFRRLLIHKVKDKNKRADIMSEIGKLAIKDVARMSLAKLREKYLNGSA
jgi:precorrin-2 dehydrogenase / sirohydrochlorin ferrochelatase